MKPLRKMNMKFSFTLIHTNITHTLIFFLSIEKATKTLFSLFPNTKKRNEARNMCEFDAYRCLTECSSFSWYIPTESHYSGLLSSFVRLSEKLEIISNSAQEMDAFKAILTFLPKLLHLLNFSKWVKNDNIIIIEWLHSTPLNRSVLSGNSSTKYEKLLTVNRIRNFRQQIRWEFSFNPQ